MEKIPRFVKVYGGLAVGAATFVALANIKEQLSTTPVVSVIKLHGIIQPGKASPFSGGKPTISLDNTRKKIDAAFKPKRLQCVLLNINSPGGSPVQCDLVSSYIREKALEREVPVIAFVEDVAASGGYWLACTAGEIYCARSSIVGSIGVIGGGFGFVEGMQKLGVERRVFTAGNNKSQLDPFLPLNEEDVARNKVILDGMHKHFIDHVTTSRGDKLKENSEKLFNGEYWTGETALELGLVDGLELQETWVKKQYGDNVTVKRLESGSVLDGIFSSSLSLLGQPSMASLMHNTTNLEMETSDHGAERLAVAALR